jgi:hypothetical protein
VEIPKWMKAARAAEASERAKWSRVKFRDNRAPETVGTNPLHGGGCWCGADFGHDWPGKADGAPHPRDWPGKVNGRPYRG